MYNPKRQYSILTHSFNSIFIKAARIFLTLITFLLAAGCSENSDTANSNEKFTPSVEAVKARLGSLPLTERLTGVVRAKNQVEIFPQINGVIEIVYVRNGDLVKRGDPIVKLRDREYQEQLKQAKANYQIALAQKKQAEAQLEQVRLELKRTESLNEKDLSSDAELEDVRTRALSAEADLDLANARVDQAQAEIDEREENLSKTLVAAPVSGSIGNRSAEVGMRVSSNNRLFTLGQLDRLEVEVVLTDVMLNYIKVGQRIELISENIPAGRTEAVLSRISPFLHPVTHSTDAEIDVVNPDGRLNPGMFVTVDVFYGESEQATLVPLSALYENPASGVTGVFVARDSLKFEIKKGSSSDNPIKLSNPTLFEFIRADIIAKGRMEAGVRGIDPGDWVVTLGQNLLGSDSGIARVNVVDWSRVEELQNMQSQDLLNQVMKQQLEKNAGESSVTESKGD